MFFSQKNNKRMNQNYKTFLLEINLICHFFIKKNICRIFPDIRKSKSEKFDSWISFLSQMNLWTYFFYNQRYKRKHIFFSQNSPALIWLIIIDWGQMMLGQLGTPAILNLATWWFSCYDNHQTVCISTEFLRLISKDIITKLCGPRFSKTLVLVRSRV